MKVKQVSCDTDPLMWWKEHHEEFPDPNDQTVRDVVYYEETKREVKRILNINKGVSV
jgi:hypothetical protein